MNRPKSRILDAIDLLEGPADRRGAARLIAEELRQGAPTGQRWGSIHKLAQRIGEIDMALDASMRHAMTDPITIGALIQHCDNLTQMGRAEEAVALLDRVPAQAQDHPEILHFRGNQASQTGDFDTAQALLRRSLAGQPNSPQTWMALLMASGEKLGDEDLAKLRKAGDSLGTMEPRSKAAYYYALGRALVDRGEVAEGFAVYEKGAAIRRELEPYDRAAQEAHVAHILAEFTPEAMAKLTPSRFTGQRALFVNGLPRSGTTMTESILVAHSKVVDGSEVALVKPALLPVKGLTMEGALAYQQRSRSDDPWGDIARDYHHMLAMRFRKPGLVVDKTLSQSMFMGLLLQAMPDARVLWLRRRPDDVALSAYRSFFSSTITWAWSMEDIAHQMMLEDKLHAHWQALYPRNILTVPYEELVSAPAEWIPRMLAHCGLAVEPQVFDFHKAKRRVRTASIKQVRAPISTDAIGKADRFAEQLEPFRKAYYG